MIQFEAVTHHTQDGQIIFRDVSFEIKQGDFVFILGASGEGKSTLFRIMTGFEKPAHGNVIIYQEKLRSLPKSALPYIRRQFGVVSHDYPLLLDKNAIDNILLSLSIRGIWGKEARQRVESALTALDLTSQKHLLAGKLSYRDQQKLTFARAIAAPISILLVDLAGDNRFLSWLYEYYQQEKLTVMVTRENLPSNLPDNLPFHQLVLQQGLVDHITGVQYE